MVIDQTTSDWFIHFKMSRSNWYSNELTRALLYIDMVITLTGYYWLMHKLTWPIAVIVYVRVRTPLQHRQPLMTKVIMCWPFNWKIRPEKQKKGKFWPCNQNIDMKKSKFELILTLKSQNFDKNVFFTPQKAKEITVEYSNGHFLIYWNLLEIGDLLRGLCRACLLWFTTFRDIKSQLEWRKFSSFDGCIGFGNSKNKTKSLWFISTVFPIWMLQRDGCVLTAERKKKKTRWIQFNYD